MLDGHALTQPKERTPGFDQILDRLRQVVAQLEQGSLSLEESLQAFEEGVRLSRKGAELLDAAERRVEVLMRGEDGQVVVAPLSSQNDREREKGDGP